MRKFIEVSEYQLNDVLRNLNLVLTRTENGNCVKWHALNGEVLLKKHTYAKSEQCLVHTSLSEYLPKALNVNENKEPSIYAA